MQTLTLTHAYFDSFSDYFYIEPKQQTKSISFIKWLSDKISALGIKKTQEMIDQLLVLNEILKTKKIKLKELPEFEEQLDKAITILNEFVNYLKDYQLDDPLAIKLLSNIEILLDLAKEQNELIKLYAEVALAQNEIKEGKTLTVDQAFDV